MTTTYTYAYGFEAISAINPASYHITEDARGRAYAFEMDETTKRHLADALRAVLDRPQDVVEFDPQPGYIRVRLEPSRREGVSARAAAALPQVASVYNERHVDDIDLDGLRFSDQYVRTYRPEDAPTAEAFLADYTGDPAVPATESPVYELAARDLPHAGGETAWLGYRIILPFDPRMYVEDGGVNRRHSFAWDEVALERFDMIIRQRDRWPNYTEAVTVYPAYVDVRTRGLGLGNPTDTAERARKAVLGYNQGRGDHPHLGDRRTRKPALALEDAAYIEGLPPREGGIDEWIAEHVADVDGEPIEPEAETDAAAGDGDGGGGSAWTTLNPFN